MKNLIKDVIYNEEGFSLTELLIVLAIIGILIMIAVPIYQNVTASAVQDTLDIKKNLIAQLTSPVRWTQSVDQMLIDGAQNFTEVGPGKVLQGLVKKINREANTSTATL